jgi:uncharacterized protein YlxW (UPF0749 family)
MNAFITILGNFCFFILFIYPPIGPLNCHRSFHFPALLLLSCSLMLLTILRLLYTTYKEPFSPFESEQVQLLSEKRSLQNELLSSRSENEELQLALGSEREKRRAAENELEEKEEELNAFVASAQERKRRQILEGKS